MRSIDKVLSVEDKIEKEILTEEKKLQKAYDKRKTQLEEEFETFKSNVEDESKNELSAHQKEVDTKAQTIISQAQDRANTLSFTQFQESILTKIKGELEK